MRTTMCLMRPRSRPAAALSVMIFSDQTDGVTISSPTHDGCQPTDKSAPRIDHATGLCCLGVQVKADLTGGACTAISCLVGVPRPPSGLPIPAEVILVAVRRR